MALFLRFVKERDFLGRENWKSAADVPSAALRHFFDERLSVFRLDSSDQIPRAIAAFALGHPNRLENNDILVVDETLIATRDFAIEVTDGSLPDHEITLLHREFVELSEDQARQLTFDFAVRGLSRRVTLGTLKAIVRFAHDNTYYDRARISDGVARDLEKVLVGADLRNCPQCGHRVQDHVNVAGVRRCQVCLVALKPACVAPSQPLGVER
jgi:hypothetical protein